MKTGGGAGSTTYVCPRPGTCVACLSTKGTLHIALCRRHGRSLPLSQGTHPASLLHHWHLSTEEMNYLWLG